MVSQQAKTVTLTDLLESLDDWLQPSLIKDYCPNGLQVEGRNEIKRILCGVTACEALIDRAIEFGADALLVHHGYFWSGESAVITGMKKRRLVKLLQHDISLLAYHLPLDVHTELGNNAGLAKQLEFKVEGHRSAGGTDNLLWYGRLPVPMDKAELAAHIKVKLAREPLLVSPYFEESGSEESGTPKFQTVAWCTGGAQGFVDQAAELGVDVYLSGEISEQTVHSAREQDICYVAAGHHATERYGVQLLGQAIANRFGVEVRFAEVNNPA